MYNLLWTLMTETYLRIFLLINRYICLSAQIPKTIYNVLMGVFQTCEINK